MSTRPVNAETPATAEPQDAPARSQRLIIGIGVIIALLLIVLMLSFVSGLEYLTGAQNTLVLAVPAFLAGLLSFLSPCTLPILPAYFAFTFQAGKRSVVLMSVAFFCGLATTMSLLGASATALSGALFANRDMLTFWGGLLIIAFGIMGMLGQGFAGPQIQERPSATLIGSYIYGATFALGWTACVGPILGALMTLLATTSNLAIFQGALLAFIYAIGLGTPLIIMSAFFRKFGQGSQFWKIIRGRGYDVQLFGRSFHLHTTSLLSGGLMVLMGALLASGRLAWISQQANGTPLAQWWVEIESAVGQLFGLN